jgi:hypothetical protein
MDEVEELRKPRVLADRDALSRVNQIALSGVGKRHLEISDQ